MSKLNDKQGALMSDRDENLLPSPAWTDVLAHLSLPFRAYQQQLMRTYEPVLQIGEQVLQAYGGWMRYWERFVYWERLVSVTGSGFDVSDWEVEEGTSPISAAARLSGHRPGLPFRGSGSRAQLPEVGKTADSDDAGGASVSSQAELERVLADLASALEIVRSQLEQLTSSLTSLFDEQLNLIASMAPQQQEGTRSEAKQAPPSHPD